jgi:hypothetical protein
MLNEAEEFLEPSDAGRILDLTSDRIRGLALEGRLRVAARTPRGLRLFRRADVEAYLAIVQRERAARGAIRRAGVEPKDSMVAG